MTPKITLDGLSVMLRGLAGDPIKFVSVKLGNGAEQDADTAKDLSNPLMELEISGPVTLENNYAEISATFTNASVEAGFRLKEIGIFVQHQDDENQKVLYAYGYDDDSVADYIASKTDRIVETQMDYLIFVGSAENVTAAISSSLVYASAEELDAHRNDNQNPHSVTAEQLGLGNVKNVAPEDMAVTFEDVTTLEGITSGERLSSVLAKVKETIRAFILHRNDKDNPHEVTAEQVGAANETHEHKSTDITSGTLPVSRGGTGLGTLPVGGILSGNGTSVVSSLRGTGALHATVSGSPKFGTLPVSAGGTGVSSLSGTDYRTVRVRGISIVNSTPTSLPSGTIALVYTT